MSLDLQERKNQLREQAHANRKAQPDKEEVSQRIVERLVARPEYAAAKTVMYYIDVRTEVKTRHALPDALASGKRIVVPYCVEGELELFLLESMEELSVGMYKILEPREDLRSVPEKRVAVEELDLVVAPGVAFDPRGARMGHGMGYYDKLLEHARPDTPLIALAFDCQVFPEIPTQEHDVFMDLILTESTVHVGRGRQGGGTAGQSSGTQNRGGAGGQG
ncbi:MAG TPA: 5-formyltetrahydrofolate cyclo-ligase [Pirellulaceae bacterium]|jgi:5-formyltetrahydrofolate cyclo-ligase|nr:5-formyltetrahydrofolate cyclo-ligase [Pirellulaceae bacterium]